jgi:AraC-like DNA-binding protein
MQLTFDNTTGLAMVRCALFMFYLVVGVRYLIFNKTKERSNYILGVLLLLWSFELLKDAVSQLYPWFLYMRKSYLLFDLLAIPLCTFYVMEMTCIHWLNWRRLFLHLVPFILWLLLFILFPIQAVYYAALGYPILYVAFVAPYIVVNLKCYETSIADNYSYKEHLDTKWLKTAILLFIINLFFCILLYSRPFVEGFYIYYAFCLAMWCYNIFHNENRQYPKLLRETEIEQRNSGDEISLDCDSKLQFKEKLSVCFEVDRLFLNPQLTVFDVALKIGTNRTYLSRYLNKNLHTTFYDYVNDFRLSYVEKQLISTELKISEIVQDSGFNSFSTLLRSFRKRHGCTPHEYRKHHVKIVH